MARMVAGGWHGGMGFRAVAGAAGRDAAGRGTGKHSPRDPCGRAAGVERVCAKNGSGVGPQAEGSRAWPSAEGRGSFAIRGAGIVVRINSSVPISSHSSPDEPLADQNPGDPQSWNLYSYAWNNPLRFGDPTGRECVALDGGGIGDNGVGE